MRMFFAFRRAAAWSLCALALTVGCNAAVADKRVALVVGNGAYQHAPRLPNPTNDAQDVAAALKRTGFDTIVGLDLDQAGMQDAAIKFARAAREADVAIFYYSGHAMQFNGTNYLMPVDAMLKDEADLRRMTRVDDIVADLQRAKNLKILVLDSCRDNPLAEELKRSIGRTRAASLPRGLAKIESPQGTIIAYSTQAGSTADDGSGRNSPYTAAFLRHIEEPREIGTIFRRISSDVYEHTKRAQLPELSLSLIGEFYLKDRSAAVPPAAGASDSQMAALQTRLKALEEQLSKKDRDEVAPADAPPAPVSLPPPARPERPRSASERCASFDGEAGTDAYCTSSVRNPQLGNRYDASNLFSKDSRTAWVEGRPGQGIGEWIVVEFDAERWVNSVTIQNGYQKGGDVFRKNSRVRTLRLVFSNGTSRSVQLDDRQGAQTIALPRPIRAYWLQFVIEDVYPGSKYDDTAISKLRVASKRVR